MAETLDDGQYDELKRKLVGRIAFAGVAAIVLLAGLAVFDRLLQGDVTAPPAALREPAARAPLPQPAPGGSPPAGFSDVRAGAFYSRAVDWLLYRGITTGVGGNRFAPGDPVTRGQMATFLWRLAGSPV